MLEFPKHVGIIMDGNGRWAEARGKPRTFGHYEGVKRTEEAVLHAKKIGIKYLTLYAFSSENWSREGYEVSVLMKLGKTFMLRRKRDIDELKMGIRFLGDREKFPPYMRKLMNDVEERSKPYEDFILQVLLSYGGQQEILRAINLVADKILSGALNPPVTKEFFEQHLYTAGIPDPDLVIRTSGEMRTSNFLPWQTIYSEWIFHQKLWPDFRVEDFDECINEYRLRERRKGGMPIEKIG